MVAKDTRKPLVALLIALTLSIEVIASTIVVEKDDIYLFLDLDEILYQGDFAADRSGENSLYVLSINLNRFFDDIDDGNDEKVVPTRRFLRRVDSTVTAFAERYGLPDVIALQEIENQNVLHHLAREVHQRYRVHYRAILIDGPDVSGINLAFLVRADLKIRESRQLFTDRKLELDDSPLFSRPPLLLEACRRDQCFTLINLHLRSMRGIDDAQKGDRVRIKRREQAETIAAWCNEFQHRQSGKSLILIGDLNALTPSDAHVDVAGILRGNPDNRQTTLPGRDLLNPDLVDRTLQIPPNKRYSYIYRKRRQQLDYLLTNQSFAAELDSIAFGRIDKRLSDHAGLFARFKW